MKSTKKFKCPYISTINKTILDFDQEKVCSVSLKDNNIYSCLVCGKYFHGKGTATPCYIHSLSEQHHLFINLETRLIYCLPDDYELKEEYVDDQNDEKNESGYGKKNILFEIKQNLLPVYTKKDIKLIDKRSANYNTSLDNKKYLPGYIGLGYVKYCEYFNVIIQSLSHLKKFRNFFLQYNHKISNKDDVIEVFVNKLSEIIKKLWNYSSYKTHIDQRECLQILEKASQKKFIVTNFNLNSEINFSKNNNINNFNLNNNNTGNDIIINGNYNSITLNQENTNIYKNDIIAFLSWLLNTLKIFLSQKGYENIIEEYFQGVVQVETYTFLKEEEANKNLRPGESIVIEDGVNYIYTKKRIKFLYLTLDLPMIPLFKDSQEKITIPQVNIYELFKKYNGEKFTEDPTKAQRKKYKILSLPKYLILIFKRFENNSFFMEKNPTIVDFQLENLVLEEHGLSNINNKKDNNNNKSEKTYSLIANIIHDGKPGDPNFRVQIKNKERNEWFEIQDIHVQKILAESVAVCESYIHFYELKNIKNQSI